jgi:hypothetical protein
MKILLFQDKKVAKLERNFRYPHKILKILFDNFLHKVKYRITMFASDHSGCSAACERFLNSICIGNYWWLLKNWIGKMEL